MIDFLVGAVILALLVLALRSLMKGEGGCDGCSNCPYSKNCRKKEEES